MRIFIVGLGLIGASYAEGLHQKGHEVYGFDQNPLWIQKGKELGFIHQDSELEKIKTVDLIILALYPKDNVEFVKTQQHLFRDGQVLTDVSGTKTWMMNEIEKILKPGISYTSMHPMAGRETSGFQQRHPEMFHKANLMIVKGTRSLDHDEVLLNIIKNDLKFGKLLVTDAKTHDQLVAFTSQLTHLIAVTLMHADPLEHTKEATGDSFRDLTRIAKINEMMWSELFLENKDVLLETIDLFEVTLNKVRQMIEHDDQESLIKFLKEAKEKRKSFDIH
jgi:prephenate dehydrogenase